MTSSVADLSLMIAPEVTKLLVSFDEAHSAEQNAAVVSMSASFNHVALLMYVTK